MCSWELEQFARPLQKSATFLGTQHRYTYEGLEVCYLSCVIIRRELSHFVSLCIYLREWGQHRYKSN